MAMIVVSVLITLHLIFSFLLLAGLGRSFVSQTNFNDALAGRVNELIERTEELTQITESAMDCLVAEDARLTELLEQEHERQTSMVPA